MHQKKNVLSSAKRMHGSAGEIAILHAVKTHGGSFVHSASLGPAGN